MTVSVDRLRFAPNAQGGVGVSGAITFDNARDALATAPGPAQGQDSLDVDLSALADADSAALAVLIAWSAQARARGVRLRYLHVPQALCNLAYLSSVESLLGFPAV